MMKVNVKEIGGGDDNVVSIYPFGSHNYRTTTPKSDRDYIVVVRNYPLCGSKYTTDAVDIEFFTEVEWLRMKSRYDVRVMECLSLDPDFKITVNDKHLFRTTYSTIYNHSWVKGKKKLITADYEPYLAIKSVYHALRLQLYAIQILSESRVTNFQAGNHMFYDMVKLSEVYHREELWNKIEDKYLSIFKENKRVISGLAPKISKKQQISEVLRTHKVRPTKALRYFVVCYLSL